VTVVVTRTVEAKSRIPPPPLARVVPSRYRTVRIWRANLTDGVIPDLVITSAGQPKGKYGYHPADLQVLSWDRLARRWTVIFDAARAKAPTAHGYTLSSNTGPSLRTLPPIANGPILDNADTTIGPVSFTPILRTSRKQLVFSATFVAGGSGYAGTLVVVDFKGGIARVLYSWYGEGGLTWSVDGGRIDARANYWAPGDAHCCPIRTYRFRLAYTDGWVTEVSDQRPWLGVIVREPGKSGDTSGPLQVIELADASLAAHVLRVGDVILDVLNVHRKGISSVFDKLSLLNAGGSAHLLIERAGTKLSVNVTLGSLLKALGQFVPEKDYSVEAL
jgi:hypothetical protein